MNFTLPLVAGHRLFLTKGEWIMLKTLAITGFILATCLAASPRSKVITIDGHKIEVGAAARPVLPVIDVAITSIRIGKVLDDDSECLVITGTVTSHLDSPRYNITVDVELFDVLPNSNATLKYPSSSTMLEMVKPGKTVPWIIVYAERHTTTTHLHYLVRASYEEINPAFKN